MRMSCWIATLNPMTEITNPARLIQSPTFIFIGSSAVIFEKGRATFTLFLGDTTLGADRDLGAGAVPLLSAISQPSHQPDGWCSHGRIGLPATTFPPEPVGTPKAGRQNRTSPRSRQVRRNSRRLPETDNASRPQPSRAQSHGCRRCGGTGRWPDGRSCGLMWRTGLRRVGRIQTRLGSQFPSISPRMGRIPSISPRMGRIPSISPRMGRSRRSPGLCGTRGVRRVSRCGLVRPAWDG
jgi:hypothetical protein